MGVGRSRLKIIGRGLKKSGNRWEWVENERVWVIVVGSEWQWV